MTASTRERIFSVDVLRGLIMVIMAIDHTREFVNISAMSFNAEDLTQTTFALFFTRWITHFCAPVFMFTAGIGAYLRLQRGGTKAELSKFLWTRGLWLLLLELTVVRLTFFFDVSYNPIFLLVFWSIGMSMIALAAMIHLPFRAILAVSVAMIAFHNLADRITPEQLGVAPWLWNIFHRPGLLLANPVLIVGYPLIPWIGVIGVGFCFGHLYGRPSDERRRIMIWMGVTMTVAFVALRFVNVYGDPLHWTTQSRTGFTLLSFLRATKYPPSLLFLLMTLGPAIAFLGLIDKVQPKPANPLVVFGRTPQFYFIMHIAVIHVVAILLGVVRYGYQPFLLTPPPTMGGPNPLYPADYGWGLTTTYLVWVVVVIVMYPMCRVLARLKASRRDWWLSYL